MWGPFQWDYYASLIAPKVNTVMQRKPVKEYGGILSAITKAKFRLHLQAEQAYYDEQVQWLKTQVLGLKVSEVLTWQEDLTMIQGACD